MKFLKTPIATPNEELNVDKSKEDYVFHVVSKQTCCDNDVHLHEDIPAATIMNFMEEKDLVSYVEFPFQIYGHDEIFEELKGINLVEKHFEDEETASASTS